MKKYMFRKYKKNYPSLFNKEKEKLEKILPKDARVEHIGSTAVPNLGGKGILDILIGIKKQEINDTKNRLINAGYTLKLSGGEKNRIFFEKDYKKVFGTRRVHLHLTAYNSKVWNQHIKIRNILRGDKKIADEYSKMKKEAVKFAEGSGEKYRQYKRKFLEDLER